MIQNARRRITYPTSPRRLDSSGSHVQRTVVSRLISSPDDTLVARFDACRLKARLMMQKACPMPKLHLGYGFLPLREQGMGDDGGHLEQVIGIKTPLTWQRPTSISMPLNCCWSRMRT